MNIQRLNKKILSFALLISSSFFLLTGCTDTDSAGQSLKSAIVAPLEGRSNGSVSDFSEKSIWSEGSDGESTADVSQSVNDSTENDMDDTLVFEYMDDTDWVKSEWPDEYAYMKGLDCNREDDVWSNGNIQRVLTALSALEGNWPGVSQREIPWQYLKEKPESYYGDHVWYEYVYLNQIERIEEGSEDAKALNNGNAFAVLHASITPGDVEKEVLLYIMNIENLDSFYSDDDVGNHINITGWYVGETNGKPSFAYPGLSGG